MTTTAMTTTTSRRPPLSLGNTPKWLPFVRAAWAVASGGQNAEAVERILDSLGDEAAGIIVQRANAAVATTSDSGWASQLAAESFGAFLGDLGEYSAASRLIAQAVPATLGASISQKYPIRTTAASAASWVEESGAIPVRQYAFSHVTIGPRKKLASVLVLSAELARRSDGFAIFERMLREDIGAGIDAALLATTAGSAAAHFGLLYGTSPIVGLAGGDMAALYQDLTSLAEAVSSGGSGQVTFLMAPERFARLRILSPELARSMDVAVSAAIPATRVIGADAAALLFAADPAPEIFVSKEASYHMSDAPGEIVSDAPVVSDPIRSGFQTDTIATRIVHALAFQKRRSTAVGYVETCTW